VISPKKWGYFLWTGKKVLPYIEIEYPIIQLLGVFLDIGYPSMVKQYPQTQSIAIKPDIKILLQAHSVKLDHSQS